MTTLVVGASGATGRQLVKHLLDSGQYVKVIVRSPENLPESWKSDARLCIIHASVLELTDREMVEYVSDCQAVASCLGHTMSWKGIYGQPRRLVTDTVRRLCNAIQANTPEKPIKYVLMNTTGNRNRDLNERISFGQKCVIGLLRLLLPPHVDNEKAADYLRVKIDSCLIFLHRYVDRIDTCQSRQNALYAPNATITGHAVDVYGCFFHRVSSNTFRESSKTSFYFLSRWLPAP